MERHPAFPVGKVNFLTLYPLSFSEYLIAIGEKLLLEQIREKGKMAIAPLIIHNKLIDYYKTFLFIGGMPEVVKYYIDNKDVVGSRTIQDEIIQAYERDFSKYSSAGDAIKISEVWQSIPGQLSRENKKFKYKEVRRGARSSKFSSSIEWLKKAGLVYLSYNVKTAKLPLKGYFDKTKFKVYLNDTGLLGAMLNLHSKIIMSVEGLFSEYNGAFVENYVANELVKSGNNFLCYWTSKSDAEVDFLIDCKNQILPLEVKSGKSRNIKSLRSYAEKYNPSRIYHTSPRSYTQDNDFINIPLYAISAFSELI